MYSKTEASGTDIGAQLPQAARQEFEKAAEFSINSTKCVIEEVEFVGNIRTRSSFLRRQFANTMKAQSLRDIVVSTRDSVQILRDLGVFDSIEAKILLDEASKPPGAAAARVQVHVKEKRIFKLKANGTLGGAAGSGGVEAVIGNALGVADTIAGNVEYVANAPALSWNNV
jgi:outer membrane protein assembly factor BamA